MPPICRWLSASVLLLVAIAVSGQGPKPSTTSTYTTPLATDIELNPAQGAAAQMSEKLDLTAADRSNDDLFNQVLWLMMKPESSAPAVVNKAPLHTMWTGQ